MRTSRSSSRPAEATRDAPPGAAPPRSPGGPAAADEAGALADARREIDRLRQKVRRLERSIARYESLAEAAQRARIWDYAVYEQVPNDEWLAIDREDCERMVRALGQTDRWRPWRVLLERRLGPV